MVEVDNRRVIREGTTRYVQITCRDKDNAGRPFDFTDCRLQTYLEMGSTHSYLPTTVAGNIVCFTIPATASVGQSVGYSVTRAFRGEDVVSIMEIEYEIVPSKKPDIAPVEQ